MNPFVTLTAAMMLMDMFRKPKRAKAPALDFVPVIFANGCDDDLPGLTAAFENRRVQYRERIYGPSEELIINRQTLAFSCTRLVFLGPETPVPPLRVGDAVVRGVRQGRLVEINDCMFLFGLRPQP